MNDNQSCVHCAVTLTIRRLIVACSNAIDSRISYNNVNDNQSCFYCAVTLTIRWLIVACSNAINCSTSYAMSQKTTMPVLYSFITFTDAGRFSKLFHCHIVHEICNKTCVIFPKQHSLKVSLHYLAKYKTPKFAKFCCSEHNKTCFMFRKLTQTEHAKQHRRLSHSSSATLMMHWCFAQNHARHRSSTASVHPHHELDRPAAAFLPIFCSEPGSDLCCWVAKGLTKWTQVSLVPEGWLSRALDEQENRNGSCGNPLNCNYVKYVKHWFLSRVCKSCNQKWLNFKVWVSQ